MMSDKGQAAKGGGLFTDDGKRPDVVLAAAGVPAPEAAVKAERRAGGRRLVTVDCMFPTKSEAIERLKRGDSVPWDDCGWRSVKAGATLDCGALDPFVVASLERNGAFTPPADDGAATDAAGEGVA